MELKKCVNCGEFIASDSDLCSSCATKLSYGKTILKNYFEDSYATSDFSSIKQISSTTGISPMIIQQYMIENNYIGQQPWGFMGDRIAYYEINESIDIHKEIDMYIAKSWIKSNYED